MKKPNIKLLSLLFAAFTMSAVMVSCGSDDTKPNPETNTEGTSSYRSYSVSSQGHAKAWSIINFSYLEGESMYDTEAKIEYKSGTATVNGSTADYDSIYFSSPIWGTGKFDMINHKGTMLVAGHGKEAKSYEASITGTLKDKSLVITIPGMMGGTTINVKLGSAPAAVAISKTYTVNTYSDFTAAGREFPKYQPTADEKITIAPSESDNYEKANISFTSKAQTSWGVFVFESVEVVKVDDSYTITGEGQCTMANPRDPEATPNVYTATISATITGNKLVGIITAEVHGVTIYLNPDDFDTVINSGN